LVEVERGQDEDPRCVIGRENPSRRLEPVELGHADVHQYDRGLEAGGRLDCVEPVTRLRDDFDLLFAGEQHAKAGPDHRLIEKWLPTGAAIGLTNAPGSGRFLSPAVAGAVLAGYAVILLLAANRTTMRRDVA
jgi:hypothetical protein